jgi:PAS domain S-box-containing protein
VERPRERVIVAEVTGDLSARLLSALALMSEATLVLNEHGAVLAANDLALEMFGYGKAAMTGQSVSQLLPLAMPLGTLQEEGGPPRRMKLEGRRANGVPFPVEASVRWIDADEKTQRRDQRRRPARPRRPGDVLGQAPRRRRLRVRLTA